MSEISTGKARIKALSKALKKEARTLFVIGAFINLLMLTSSIYMLQVLDRVLSSSSTDTLFWLTALALLALSVFGILELIRRRILARMGVVIENELAPAALDAAIQTGEGQTSSGHIAAVKNFVAGDAASAFLDAPWTPLFLLGITMIHPWLGLVSLIGLLLLFLASLLNDLGTRPFNLEQRKRNAQTQASASEVIARSNVVRALGMRDRLVARVDDETRAQRSFSLSGMDRSGGWMAASRWLRMILQIAVLAVGAWLALRSQISAGGMIAASILLGRAAAPVERSMSAWQSMVLARAGWRDLHKLFDAAEAKRTETAVLPAPRGALVFKDVTAIAAGAESSIFAGLSGEVSPGTLLGITGPSGAGKTTLGMMCVGLSTPASGAITLDGANVAHRDDNDLGQFVGYLPQSIDLLSGTVAENICRFGENDEAAILSAARAAGADEFIAQLPKGYATPIGREGLTLSGGQMQRLALARALYQNPHLIVLDEPGSGQDKEGLRSLALAARQAADRGAVVLLITHDRQLLNICDRALLISGGKGVFHERQNSQETPAKNSDHENENKPRQAVDNSVGNHEETTGQNHPQPANQPALKSDTGS